MGLRVIIAILDQDGVLVGNDETAGEGEGGVVIGLGGDFGELDERAHIFGDDFAGDVAFAVADDDGDGEIAHANGGDGLVVLDGDGAFAGSDGGAIKGRGGGDDQIGDFEAVANGEHDAAVVDFFIPGDRAFLGRVLGDEDEIGTDDVLVARGDFGVAKALGDDGLFL